MELEELVPVRGEWYQTYTPDTKRQEAWAAFLKKYHHEPPQIFRFQSLVWAGPVQVQEAGR